MNAPRRSTLYYVKTGYGCAIIAACGISQARALALREVGTSNFEGVRRATKEDVAWVEGMGGRVPEGVAL